MTVAEYHVTGMTCGHCERAVEAEIRRIGGVADVSVDLSSGRVQVSSDVPLADADVRAAVEEAGYELA